MRGNETITIEQYFDKSASSAVVNHFRLALALSSRCAHDSRAEKLVIISKARVQYAKCVLHREVELAEWIMFHWNVATEKVSSIVEPP